MIEKQNITNIIIESPLEQVLGTTAELYDELLIDEIAACAAYGRLSIIGSRLNTVSMSLMNRSTVNNIRLEGMRNQYIASLIAETPEFSDDSPEGQNKQAEHVDLINKSDVAEIIVRQAAPETMSRQYLYDELIANRAAISQRIGIVASRVSAIYIEHTNATLELIKVREQIRLVETRDNSSTTLF